MRRTVIPIMRRYEETYSRRFLSSSPASVSQALLQRVDIGNLHFDKEQKRIAKQLSRLQKALHNYDNSILFVKPEEEEKVVGEIPMEQPKSNGSPAYAEKTTASQRQQVLNEPSTQGETLTEPKVPSEPSPSDPSKRPKEQDQLPTLKIPRGLYIYGNVGTGKTMLMDEFYSVVNVKHKKRYHFHAFLTKVHNVIHQLKQQDLKERGRSFHIDTSLENNPIYKVGLQISSEISVLCLDEFQVTDIADAVILSQLFTVLFAKGTVVVVTSNRPPDDLYEGGINRSYFLPFIDLLKHHMIITSINSKLDYRKLLSSSTLDGGTTKTKNSLFIQQQRNSATDSNEMEKIVADLKAQIYEDDGNNDSASVLDLDVGFGRAMTVSNVYGSGNNNGPVMAIFSFDELCACDVGALEYHAIANKFDIVVLQDIPYLSVAKHNIARRFITLVDELYEGKCALLCSCEASHPSNLFRQRRQQQQYADEKAESSSLAFADESTTSTEESSTSDSGAIASCSTGNDGDVGDMRDLDIATTQGGTPIGALASVRELEFAFERASSRLIEMCSESWWARHI